MNYYLPFIPNGTLIRFPNSATIYLKVCGRNSVGGIVAIDSGRYIKSSDLYYLDMPTDNVEIVAERGAWSVHCDVES